MTNSLFLGKVLVGKLFSKEVVGSANETKWENVFWEVVHLLKIANDTPDITLGYSFHSLSINP